MGEAAAAAAAAVRKKKVCLTMIARNEEGVLARCLGSIREHVDRWVLVDTGSTDGTKAVATAAMESVPGGVQDRVWKGFGDGRTAAFEHAREGLRAAGEDLADWYAFVMDADEVFEGAFVGLEGGEPNYALMMETGSIRFPQSRLFRLDLPWRYVGVLHEYPACDLPTWSMPRLDSFRLRAPGGGARSKDPDKYVRDARTFEEALLEEKDLALASRYVFYMAQSYRDARQDGPAREAYLRRTMLGGGCNMEEVCVSYLEAARAAERLGLDEVEVWSSYLKAYSEAPHRAEALHDLTRYCRLKGRHALAWVYASAGYGLKLPADGLFVGVDVYAWKMADEYALAAYWTGRKALAAEVNRALLADPRLPEDQRARVLLNLEWSERS